MKKTTKLWVGVAAAGAGVWAWMRYGGRAKIAASRVVPPGYVSQTNIIDRGIPSVRYIYPALESDAAGKFARVLTVPVNENLPGYWGAMRA